MPEFHKTIKLKDLPPGQGLTLKVGDSTVALFNVGGKIYAMDDQCPHAGGPLGAGPVDGEVVTCPWHGWQFNIPKACAVMSDEIQLKKYPVKIKDEVIYIAEEA